MLGSLNELVHSDIEYLIEGHRRMIPWEHILSYDIDYDVTKIRFWKDHEGVRISRRWIMPVFKDGEALVTWLAVVINEFRDQTITEDELDQEKTKGYVKGGQKS